MKAKRLRALLVAGLLSLAPAVTLTSCSGGGGGGGGSESSEVGSLAQLSGHYLRFTLGTKTFKFTFKNGNIVHYEYRDIDDPTINGTLDGQYRTPNVHQVDGVSSANTELRFYDIQNGQEMTVAIVYTIGNNGGLKPTDVRVDGGANIASACLFDR